MLILFCAILFFNIDVAYSVEMLSLDGYLKQVQESNFGFKASLQNSQAQELESNRGSLLFSPNAFATTQVMNDEKLNANPMAQGSKTYVESYSLGVSKQFEFGLQSKLSYFLNYYSIEGAAPTFLKTPKVYEAKTILDLTFPLWRNVFARETKATKNLIKSKALQAYYGERYKIKALIAEAEVNYWKLALAKEAVRIQKDVLARSEKLYQWHQERYQKQLGEKTDLLQAEAAVKGKVIDLQMAKDEEAGLMRAFNTGRGSNSEVVPEILSSLEEINIRKLLLPSFVEEELREDVKAVEQQKIMIESASTIGHQEISPGLDLYGQVALNGRNQEFKESTSQSFKKDFPTLTVGVKLTMPLDIQVLREVKKGYAMEKYSAENFYNKKIFDLKQEWFDLQKRYKEMEKKLTLVKLLEEIQAEKAKHERDQLQRGRTTTFQVLNFEQEYAGARLNYIKIKTELLKMVAQMKLFGKLQLITSSEE